MGDSGVLLGCYLNSISPWTKWPPFRRGHFQLHFHEWKVLYFDSNFTEVCFLGPNWQKVIITSGNGLAPNRRQAITWSNVDPVLWRIYAALGGDELTHRGRVRHICICNLGLHLFRKYDCKPPATSPQSTPTPTHPQLIKPTNPFTLQTLSFCHTSAHHGSDNGSFPVGTVNDHVPFPAHGTFNSLTPRNSLSF